MQKDKFIEVVKNILTEIGIAKRKVDHFINDNVTLKSIGVCLAISDLIDDHIKQIDPTYDGCVPKDTLEDMWDWNYCRYLC